MPAYVSGEGEPYRPELLLWMSDDGLILGTTMARPGEIVASAADHLRDETIEHPMIGAPSAPKRVRVASPELADALRAAHPAIEIVCAPTPEIDAAVAEMREHMDAGDDAEDSYLTPEVDAPAMASFFRTAARLFRAKPWKVVPDGESLFSVTIEELEVRDAAACVIGHLGESFGVVLFSDVASFDAYTLAAGAMQRGEAMKMPPMLALNFERRAELSPPLLNEIADHQWEVAGASAYPRLVVMDEDLVARPPTPREVTLFEALSLALVEVVADKPALLSAWSGGPAFTRTLSVETHAGAVEVSLGASLPPAAPPRPLSEILADLVLLEEDAKDGEEIDDEARVELEDELMSAFVESPESDDIKNGRRNSSNVPSSGSHGEAFLSVALNRFFDRGLYILDEPESALSPQRQLAFLGRMHQLVRKGSQFIVSTHSPSTWSSSRGSRTRCSRSPCPRGRTEAMHHKRRHR